MGDGLTCGLSDVDADIESVRTGFRVENCSALPQQLHYSVLLFL